MMATTASGRAKRKWAPKGTAVMADDEIVRVRALVDEHGPATTGKMLGGIARNTVLSILARVPIFASNAELVRMKLAGLKAASECERLGRDPMTMRGDLGDKPAPGDS